MKAKTHFAFPDRRVGYYRR